MKNIINIKILVYLLFAIISIIGEYIFQDFDNFSDGLNYYNAYVEISRLNLIDGFSTFKIHTGSTEPISFGLLYFLSQFLDFHHANIVLNFFLLLILWKYFKNYSVSIYIWLPIVITNYYFLLIGYAVLRLKIAIIFYFAFLYRKKYIFGLLSIFSHFQMALMYIFNAPILLNKKIIFSYKFYTSVLIILILLFFSNIDDKINHYMISGEEYKMPIKCFYIGFFSFFVIKDFKKAVTILLLVLMAVIFLGEGRITLIYFLLVFANFMNNPKNNIIARTFMSVSLLYLSIKGIDFGVSWSNQENYFN